MCHLCHILFTHTCNGFASSMRSGWKKISVPEIEVEEIETGLSKSGNRMIITRDDASRIYIYEDLTTRRRDRTKISETRSIAEEYLSANEPSK